MDNKITKKRVSHFLSYEWIAILAVIIVAVVFIEFFYSLTSVKLKPGQQFKIYYDENISFTNNDRLEEYLLDNNTFSFGVLDIDIEEANKEFNVIGYRVLRYEGDVVITDDFLSTEEDATKFVRAKSIVDDMSVYSLDKLLSDAKAYLKGFLTSEDGDITNTQDYSLQKIESNFRARVKKDNGYRTKKAIEQGILDEQQRIFRLIDEIKDFEKVLSLPESYFFNYTKYEQAYLLASDETDSEKSHKEELRKGFIAQQAQNEKDYGTSTARYGLRLDKFEQTNGKLNATEYFKRSGNTSSQNTMILAFDFIDEQPDLQFETIFFINQICRAFSNVLD